MGSAAVGLALPDEAYQVERHGHNPHLAARAASRPGCCADNPDLATPTADEASQVPPVDARRSRSPRRGG